jgi:hypothetical protein
MIPRPNDRSRSNSRELVESPTEEVRGSNGSRVVSPNDSLGQKIVDSNNQQKKLEMNMLLIGIGAEQTILPPASCPAEKFPEYRDPATMSLAQPPPAVMTLECVDAKLEALNPQEPVTGSQHSISVAARSRALTVRKDHGADRSQQPLEHKRLIPVLKERHINETTALATNQESTANRVREKPSVEDGKGGLSELPSESLRLPGSVELDESQPHGLARSRHNSWPREAESGTLLRSLLDFVLAAEERPAANPNIPSKAQALGIVHQLLGRCTSDEAEKPRQQPVKNEPVKRRSSFQRRLSAACEKRYTPSDPELDVTAVLNVIEKPGEKPGVETVITGLQALTESLKHHRDCPPPPKSKRIAMSDKTARRIWNVLEPHFGSPVEKVRTAACAVCFALFERFDPSVEFYAKLMPRARGQEKSSISYCLQVAKENVGFPGIMNAHFEV